MPTPFRFDPNLLRDLLNGRLHELRAEVHAAHLARQAPDAPDPREVGDRKDEAARHQLDDLGAASRCAACQAAHEAAALR